MLVYTSIHTLKYKNAIRRSISEIRRLDIYTVAGNTAWHGAHVIFCKEKRVPDKIQLFG